MAIRPPEITGAASPPRSHIRNAASIALDAIAIIQSQCEGPQGSNANGLESRNEAGVLT